MLKVPRVLQVVVPLDRPEQLVREVTSAFAAPAVAKAPKVALVRVDLAEREVASEIPVRLEPRVPKVLLVPREFREPPE